MPHRDPEVDEYIENAAGSRPRTPLRVPADLSAALKKNAKARAAFGAFPTSHKREYVEWITGAKTAERARGA